MMSTNSESTAVSTGYEFPLLDVSVRTDAVSTWLVEVRGELDLATGPKLHEYLEPYNALSRSFGSPERIVYHLSNLDFIDVAGLNALLTAVDGHGRDTLTVREPSARVRRLLELLALDSMIEDVDQQETP